ARALGLPLPPAVPHGGRHDARGPGGGRRMSTLHRTILAAALALVVSMSGEALAQVHGEHHAPPPGDGHAAHAGHDPTAGPRPLTAIPPLSDADRAAAFP